MTTEQRQSLAEVIASRRSETGQSLRAVRDASGCAIGYLQRLERGEVKEPSPHVLRRLAPALGVSYVDLMVAAGYL